MIPKGNKRARAKERLKRWLTFASSMPSHTMILLAMAEQLEDNYSSASDLTALAGLDQAITLRLMRMGGSAAYGGIPPTTLSQAIMRIGFKRIAEVVHHTLLTQTRVTPFAPGAQDMFEDFWSHGIITSLAAVELKKRSGGATPETLARARFLGLVHDVGRLILLMGDPYAHEEVVHGAARGHLGSPIREHRVFGFSHEDVGVLLAPKWNLGGEVRWVMSAHHVPTRAPRRQLMVPLVHLADWIAIKIQEEWTADLKDPDRGSMRVLHLQPSDIRLAMASTRKEWERVQGSIQEIGREIREIR